LKTNNQEQAIRGMTQTAIFVDEMWVNKDNKVDAELENRFSYHTPNATQIPRYNEIREAVKQLAYTIKKLTPTSREQAVALNHLDQVMFNANAAIARNEK
jgi:hypothetical protein